MLQPVLKRALAKNAAFRPPSAASFAAELQHALPAAAPRASAAAMPEPRDTLTQWLSVPNLWTAQLLFAGAFVCPFAGEPAGALRGFLSTRAVALSLMLGIPLCAGASLHATRDRHPTLRLWLVAPAYLAALTWNVTTIGLASSEPGGLAALILIGGVCVAFASLSPRCYRFGQGWLVLGFVYAYVNASWLSINAAFDNAPPAVGGEQAQGRGAGGRHRPSGAHAGRRRRGARRPGRCLKPYLPGGRRGGRGQCAAWAGGRLGFAWVREVTPAGSGAHPH